MPRAGLNTSQVVTSGAERADEAGIGAVSFAALAERLGVKAPALYKHVDSIVNLQHRVATRDRLPIGRGATPEEAAGAIAFLASEDALFINGVNPRIDGGLHASNGQPNFLSLFGQS